MSITDELIGYSKDVLSGTVVACQMHKWACLRFLKDFEKQETEAFPFVFMENKADRYLRWMGLFKHRKGVLKGKNIVPHIIQTFVFSNIYGWINTETSYRRFNKMYWQMARKNAKTQGLAGCGSYEQMALDESGQEMQEVYIAATKTEQAKICYDEIVAMLNGCDLLKGKFKVAYGRITHIKSGSIIRPLSEEDRKTGDGLNPQCGIIDEYHAHETSEMYDVIDSGMGARSQPLLAIITTAGFDLNNPCYRVEYDLVKKLLNPDIPLELDSYFAMVNELDKNETSEIIVIGDRKIPPGELIDDIKDENIWQKANPIICSYPEGKDYLRKKLAEALEAPEKMRNFLTKHMNVWVNQRECGYMDMARWAVCGQSDIEKLPNTYKEAPFGCFDMSATLDLTSSGFIFTLPGGAFYVKSHSFMPEETLEKKRKTDKVPYDLWVKQGWITLTPGAEVDYHFVLEWFIEQYEKNKWYRGEVCFDRALATWLEHELQEEGFTPIDIPQSFTGLSLSTKTFRTKVYNRKIIHDNNPVLTWAISNAVTRSGPSENLMLDKSKAKQRIDPIACLINGFVRAMANEQKETGGRVFFV